MRHPALVFVLLRYATARASPILFSAATTSHVAHPELWSAVFWQKMSISGALVLLGGVFAGLTIALMGLDELHLHVLAASSRDARERKNAADVLALLKRGRHWVLVVLLLANVIINESLPIFLDSAIGGGLAAVVISTTLIVIFGEIIPQALSVRYGLSIGAACAPLVLGMMYLFAPIAWPIARLLDALLGVEGTHTYNKTELRSFLQFHRTGEEPLMDDEISILNGVLELGTKRVEQLMTPIQDVVSLSADAVLDHQMVEKILMSGYSRIPVHEPHDRTAFVGFLLIKRLLQYDTNLGWPVSRIPLSVLPEAHPTISCFQALDYFQTGRAHLLLISLTPGKPGGAIGVLTLEDIIEEILSEEIVDETDLYQDNVSKKYADRLTTAAVMRGIVERTSNRTRFESFSSAETIRPTEDSALEVFIGSGAITPRYRPSPAPSIRSIRRVVVDYGSTIQ